MGKQNWKAGNMLYPVPAVMGSCKAKSDKISGNNKNNGNTGKKSKENRPNIITLAWAGTVCSDPVMLSISVRPERYSHDIIEQSGEFCFAWLRGKVAAIHHRRLGSGFLRLPL